jgi:hypothetical protein
MKSIFIKHKILSLEPPTLPLTNSHNDDDDDDKTSVRQIKIFLLTNLSFLRNKKAQQNQPMVNKHVFSF